MPNFDQPLASTSIFCRYKSSRVSSIRKPRWTKVTFTQRSDLGGIVTLWAQRSCASAAGPRFPTFFGFLSSPTSGSLALLRTMGTTDPSSEVTVLYFGLIRSTCRSIYVQPRRALRTTTKGVWATLVAILTVNVTTPTVCSLCRVALNQFSMGCVLSMRARASIRQMPSRIRLGQTPVSKTVMTGLVSAIVEPTCAETLLLNQLTRHTGYFR